MVSLFALWLLLDLGVFARGEETGVGQRGYAVPRTIHLATVTDDMDDFDDGFGKVGSCPFCRRPLLNLSVFARDEEFRVDQ